MSKKFVRNITGTKIKGDKIEPLKTNVQNDLLSDDEDVAIRNQNEYHCLTDNIKTLETNSDIVTIENHKNHAVIDVKETEIVSKDKITTVNNPEPNEFEISVKETEIKSIDERLIIDNIENNEFELDLDLSKIEEDIEDLKDYTGNNDEYPELDLSNYALRTDLDNHVNDKNNPHEVKKEDIGLDRIENYSPVEFMSNRSTLNNTTQSYNIVRSLRYFRFDLATTIPNRKQLNYILRTNAISSFKGEENTNEMILFFTNKSGKDVELVSNFTVEDSDYNVEINGNSSILVEDNRFKSVKIIYYIDKTSKNLYVYIGNEGELN